MSSSKEFSLRNLLFVLLLTVLVGIGAYAVAWQFNGGIITRTVIGTVFFGMALPSLFIGGVMRLFRPDLQKYFAISAGLCIACGVVLVFA
jgi:ABC-type dipeptide/oligopeptide/nickel transport system permease component